MVYSLYMCLKNIANIELRRHTDRSLMALLVLLVVRCVEIPYQTCSTRSDIIQDEREVSIYLYLDSIDWAVRTLIRLILEEQSDLVLHCLLYLYVFLIISGLHAVVYL